MKILLIPSTLLTLAVAVPFQLRLMHRKSECMWDLLKESESATLSVIILEGSSLKATLILEGPFAKPDVESTFDLVQAESKFTKEKHRWTNHDLYREVVDFEHLQLPLPEHDDEEYMHSETGNDDDEVPESKEEDMAVIQQQIEQRHARLKEKRRKLQEIRNQRAARITEHAEMTALNVREAGAPQQKTITARSDGWYRGCVEAEFNRINVELEFRTTKELGGIDPETNHVYSYEKWMEIQEEQFLEEDKPENEPSIKVEDFVATRDRVKDLNQLLNRIMNMQEVAKRRVQINAELGEHIHSEMTRFSIIMTILFIAATAFQVFTIHRWFSSGSSSLLGR